MSRSIDIRCLVVGAGGTGASGSGNRGGGGGGGGQVVDKTVTFVPGTYTVTVGQGSSSTLVAAGYSRIGSLVVAIAGGNGMANSLNGGIPSAGASGGGAGGCSTLTGGGNSLIPGGFNGAWRSSCNYGGGGGGANGDGSSSTGGVGLNSDITGSNVEYGTGGDGSSGGQNGASSSNYGGGSGGRNTSTQTAGTQGIVMMRYNATTLADAGLTISNTGASSSSVGGDTLLTWTSSGDVTIGVRSDKALSGTVTLNGSAVSGATVRVVRQSTNETVASTTTAMDGTWSVAGVSENEEYDCVVEYSNGGTFYNAKNVWNVVPV